MNQNESVEGAETVYIDRFDLDFALPRPNGKRAPRRPSLKTIDKAARTGWATAPSLQPDDRLSERIAFGDPANQKTLNAYAICNAWKFKPQPLRVVSAAEMKRLTSHQFPFTGKVQDVKKGATRKRKPEPTIGDVIKLVAAAPEGERDRIVARAWQIASQRGACEPTLVKADEVGDAAMGFCRLILHLVDTGEYQEEGKLDHWLNKRYKSFSVQYLREFRAEHRGHAELIEEFEDEGGQDGAKNLQDEHTLRNYQLQQKELDFATSIQRGIEKSLETFTPGDVRLFDLLLALTEADDGQSRPPTNVELAGKLGVSEAAVRKQRKSLQGKLGSVRALVMRPSEAGKAAA